MAKKRKSKGGLIVALALTTVILAGGAAGYVYRDKLGETGGKAAHWWAETFGGEVKHEKDEDSLVVVDPTCTEKGSKTWKCKVCGENIVEEIEAKGHTEDEETVTIQDSTCSEEGWKKYTCLDCGEEVEEAIEKKPHNEEVIGGIPSTCTESGWTPGKKCIDCGEITMAPIETGKRDHNEVVLEAVDPTCAEKGLTEGKQCADCGEVTQAQEEIDALDHHYGEDSACEVCGYQDIAALYPNGYDLVAVQPNENMSGRLICLGDVDAETSLSYVISAPLVPYLTGGVVNGETWGSSLGNIFEHDGKYFVKVLFFTVISLEEGEAYFVVDHSEEVIPGYEATCTEEGLTDGLKCPTCDQVYVEQEVIPALGHHYGYDNACEGCGSVSLHSLFMTSDTSNLGFFADSITFNGVEIATLSTIDMYEDFELSFTIKEVLDVRGAMQIGIGAPATDTEIMAVPYVQFNYDRPVVVANGENNNYWLNGQNWTLRVQGGLLTLSCENGVVCENLDIGAAEGYLILRAESSCALTLSEVSIVKL